MRKTCKSRVSKGAFTLLEMVLVVAIIVILASALIFGVTGYINGANRANNMVSDSAQELEQHVNDSEAELAGYGF
ncbi:MAG: type II secretion system protein [Clostridiales bacterium]|nr:type II secretion system protein [Clostridiales bacterium]